MDNAHFYIRWRLWTFLVVALAFSGTAQDQSDRNGALERLVLDWYKHILDTDGWFAEHRASISPETARQAREISQIALYSRNFAKARAFGGFALLVYRKLGSKVDELDALLDGCQIQFVEAETLESYMEARKLSLKRLREAESLNQPHLALRAAAIAADCSFFSCKGEDFGNDDRAIQAFRDLEVATRLLNGMTTNSSFERVVELIGAETGGPQRVLADDAAREEKKAVLKQITTNCEKGVPINFTFSAERKRLPRTVEAGKALAKLSYNYGNPALASQRLSAVAELAQRANKPGLRLQAISAKYAGERRCGIAQLRLAELRQEVRSAALQARKSYFSRAGRLVAGHELEDLYGEMLLDQLKESGNSSSPELFDSVEMLKARTLLDNLKGAPKTPPTEELAEENRRLESEILGFASNNSPDHNYYAEEMNLVSHLFPDDALFPSEDRTKNLEKLEQLYHEQNCGYLSVAEPARLSEVQQHLEPGEAMLEYCIPYDSFNRTPNLSILWLTRTNAEHVCVALSSAFSTHPATNSRMSTDGTAPVDRSPLGDEIVNLRAEIRMTEDKQALERLRFLYQILIEPLRGRGFSPGNFKRLIVVPHSVLHYLPFQALVGSDGEFLIRHNAVCIVPSASTWLHLTHHRVSGGHLIAFGNPELDYSAKELAAVAKLLPPTQAEMYLTNAADRFLQEAPKANLLYISSHGKMPDENALDSHSFRLGGTSAATDVSASEIRELDLSATSLAVLSICNGGLYRVGPSDEPYGLVPAFFEAGAKNILATLWSLDDSFASRFMPQFCENLRFMAPSEAFRQVCLSSIERGEFLRRWSGFVFVGPGRAP